MLTLFKRDFTIGRRITLVIFNLVIIAKLKRDNLYNINDKSSPYVMRLPTSFFAQKQEKARFNRTFQGGAGDRT